MSRLSVKTWIQLVSLICFSFLIGFSYNYHLPKLEAYLLRKVKNVSQEQSPIRVKADHLKFHLIPLSVVLENVQLEPKDKLQSYLAPAVLSEVHIQVALWPLLRGDVRLSQVLIRNATLNLFLRPELFEKTAQDKPTRLNFEDLYKLPIDEIILENIQLQGKLEPQNVVFKLPSLDLTIENRYKSIFIDIQAPQMLVKPSGPVKPLDMQLELRTLIESDEVQISAFKLKADESYIVASGRFTGDVAGGNFNKGAFDARTRVNLSDFNIWERVFLMKTRLPEFQGRLETNLSIELPDTDVYKIKSDLKLNDLEIADHKIGNISGHLQSDLKGLNTESLMFESSAGKIELQKLQMTFASPLLGAGSKGLPTHASGKVKIKAHQVEIHKLLKDLKVGEIPVHIPVQAEADCSFTASIERPELNCGTQVQISKGRVSTEGPRPQVIVEAENLRAKGDFKVDIKQVEYNGELLLGKNSKGTSNGIINFNNGFKINYTADHLEFSDIKNLVDLKIEGSAQLSGTTTGTSKWAVIDMKFDGRDLWLEDYPMGSASGRIGYKAGHLLFNQIQGHFEVTRYNGWVEMDLLNDRIRLSGQIPFMELKDLRQMFGRKYLLPFEISGTGTGKVEAEGPFQFNEMSYTFRSTFYRGVIANESFDEFFFNVRSVNGDVKQERITLTKSAGSIDVKGQINPKGEIDAVAIGRGIRLEQSENVVSYGLDLQGITDFSVLIRGQLPRPKVELNGRLSKMVLADLPTSDSVFKLNFLSDRMEGSGQFLGNTVNSEFKFPYTKNSPFAFKMKTQKLDFTNIFSLISRSAQQMDFSTSLTMTVDLKSETGGFWNSTGRADISEMVIRKVGRSMKAERPMALVFNHGVVNSENFALTSGDSYLKLNVAGLTEKNLNASLNGKLDLSLLGLFTPFISDLRGNMALSVDLKGTAAQPGLSGSAYIEKGYAKIVDFLHPFSNVRADILFNDNKMVLNSVRSDFAGGRIAAEGAVRFENEKRPIDIKGTFNDVKLNIPENFRTFGSGTVAIYGNGFPYTLDINYQVAGGAVTYEIGEGSTGAATVKASSFLPRFLDQKSFHPFTLLVDITLNNPVSVENSLMAASVTGRTRVSGTTDRLILDGSFSPLPGAKVFFGEQPFDVNSAYVEYNNAPPNDPKLYLTASTRVAESVLDEQGRGSQNQYDVNMLVQGRGQAPQFTLTSQPPLGQREIVSLLALGITGATTGTDDRKSSELQNANTSAALGAALLSRAGGKRVKESLGVDVKVSSSQPTPDNASAPKVTLSKQWTPKFGASASSTIGSNPNNNVKLEYKMNQSVSVIGSWEGRETLRDQQKDTTVNVLGLDLQYKVQFK